MHGRQRVEDAHITDLVSMRVNEAVLHAMFLHPVDEIRAFLVAHAADPEGTVPHCVDRLATRDRVRHDQRVPAGGNRFHLTITGQRGHFILILTQAGLPVEVPH